MKIKDGVPPRSNIRFSSFIPIPPFSDGLPYFEVRWGLFQLGYPTMALPLRHRFCFASPNLGTALVCWVCEQKGSGSCRSSVAASCSRFIFHCVEEGFAVGWRISRSVTGCSRIYATQIDHHFGSQRKLCMNGRKPMETRTVFLSLPVKGWVFYYPPHVPTAEFRI